MLNRFSGKQGSLAAFTLIELVIVMAVLAILGAITIGGLSSGRGGAKVSQAKSELQVIQHGLEAYRGRFGDYPRIPQNFDTLSPVTTKEAYLFNALHGRIGPAHQKVDNIPSMLNSASLSFEKRELPFGETLLNNRILDPWGKAYVYDYRPDAKNPNWEIFGYILYSFGPNGEDEGGAGDDLVAQ